MKKILMLALSLSLIFVAGIPAYATNYNASSTINVEVVTPGGAAAWNIFNQNSYYLFSANRKTETVYTTRTVNLRPAPTTKCTPYKAVPKATKLTRIGDSPCTWDMVMLDGDSTVYWIWDAYLTKNSSGNPAVSATGTSVSSSMLYTPSQLKRQGVIKWNGYRWTWYSQRVLPGKGLKIPGRHVDSNGYVCDQNGYICVASGFLAKGTVINTPFGKKGKIYDYCGTKNTLDIYVNW